MTTSLPTTPRAIVVRSPDPSAEVEGYLDGRFIGSSTDHAQTAAEVSRAAYETQRDDPTSVFGATAGPREGVPILATYLEMAKARIAQAFQSSPKVLERLERAMDYAARPDRYAYERTVDTLTFYGDKPYTVDGATCTCRDFFVRQNVNAGMCKHILAWELIRLAQALYAADEAGEPLPAVSASPTAPSPAETWNASALIASQRLAHALAPVAQGQGLVQLSIADGKLAITDVAEPSRTTGPMGVTEARDAGTLAISRGAFAQFLAAYRNVWNTANTVWFFLDVFEGEAALEIQTDDDALSMRFDAAVL